MNRIVLTHISGSKAQQTEEFTADAARDLMVGREPSAQVRFDADRDDLVGRQHARILRDPADPFKYSLVDLNSRNGTFLNRQRVVGTAALTHGDVIQLGPGGPEFQFAFDPPPAHLVKATRLSSMPGMPAQATREVSASSPASAGIGKATVERMVNQAREDNRRSMLSVTAGLLVILATVGIWAWSRPKPVKTYTTEELATNFSGSVVQVEFAWHLVMTQTGEQIYHEYALMKGPGGRPMRVPVFERTGDGGISPKLSLSKGVNEENAPIACGGTGTGFVVTTDGYIVTNRHVGANWESYYSCFPSSGIAIVVAQGEKDEIVDMGQIPRWTPAMAGREGTLRSRFTGKNTMLDVTFKLDKKRIPASGENVSDRADVAVIKINTPQPLRKLDMVDTYDKAAVGQIVTAMGYPGVSPKSIVELASLDPLAREKRWTTVPDPTVTPGTIGRIFRGAMQAAQSTVVDYQSGMGDTYQLTINATGGGNSGGPVFDNFGHVIGIFTYAQTDAQGTRITFAVPIRYALELMTVGQQAMSDKAGK
jgi:serine protease Do